MKRSTDTIPSAASVQPSAFSDVARQRILSLKGDPFLLADWRNVVFLHFAINPDALRPLVPAPLELELHEGNACVSLVALTMRHFRPFKHRSLAGWMFFPLGQQSFLNVRTYVRWRNEPGAFFLWGWLSKPFGVGLPLERMGLPCGFCSLEYDHSHAKGRVLGLGKQGGMSLKYHATIAAQTEFTLCQPGSLAEFAMERYTGFFSRGAQPWIFRAWHEPWLQTPLDIKIEEDGLLREKFPWFKEAKLAGVNFAPGFDRVWLGRAHQLRKARLTKTTNRRVLSAFYEMP